MEIVICLNFYPRSKGKGREGGKGRKKGREKREGGGGEEKERGGRKEKGRGGGREGEEEEAGVEVGVKAGNVGNGGRTSRIAGSAESA